MQKVVGLGRVELPTSPLSGVRSNRLSYRPGSGRQVLKQLVLGAREKQSALLLKGGDPAARSRTATLLRLHPSH